ncbi:MAG: 4Fe-4S dicluster domain-containing protein, partial [Deltaproteobacteria bacterium]|nr:4Fe-4S dicluster domain-containing protein [Deltaproteobacteria bacterium]
ALFRDEKVGHTMINEVLCSGCAVCVGVCPKGAIVIAGEDK